jgi:RNA polymerase sigma factor (sigma-70 family)
VQETFSRVFARRRLLRGGDRAVEAYLRSTIVNLTRKHWHRRGRERTALERQARRPTTTAVPPDVGERERLWQLLLRLPTKQRTAVVLRYYADLSERDTAQALGCAPGTVKSLVHRALNTLRDQLDGDV